jgi:hypothetical protein
MGSLGQKSLFRPIIENGSTTGQLKSVCNDHGHVAYAFADALHQADACTEGASSQLPPRLFVEYRLLCQVVDAREQLPRYQVAFATHVFKDGSINNANLPSRVFNCSSLFERADHFAHG